MGYYTGDPGFFSLLRGAGSFAASFIPGVGGVASKAISKIPVPVKAAVMKAGGAIVKHPVISAAGGAAVLAAGAGELGRMSVGGRGRHKPSARHLHALAMGLKRAKPRMQVTNTRALRRALRRAHGFARLAMKTIHLVHPRKKGRFGGFKARKRK